MRTSGVTTARGARSIGALVLAISASAPVAVAMGAPRNDDAPTLYAGSVDASTTPFSPAAAIAELSTGPGRSALVRVDLAGSAPQSGVVVTVRKDLFGPGSDILPTWQAVTMLGAFGDLTTRGPSATGDVGPSSVRFALPGGGVLDPGIALNTGSARAHQVFGADRDAIHDLITASAAAHGLTVKDVQYITGLSDNPLVTLVAPVPDAVAHRAAFVADAFGRPAPVEGYYVEIQDPSGAVLTREAAAFRSAAFLTWNDPRVDDVAGFVNAGPPRVARTPAPEIRGARLTVTRTGVHAWRLTVATNGHRVRLSSPGLARPTMVAPRTGTSVVSLPAPGTAPHALAIRGTATRGDTPATTFVWRLRSSAAG